jgi:Rhodanese-related sulfurtransferase
LSRRSVYDQLHIPHALHVQPKLLVRQEEQAMGLLPDQAGLEQLISYLNISPEHHVVVYDDEGGAWAGRLIWNLHCLGFENTSLLNGGIHAWLGAGLPTSSEIEQFEPVSPLVEVSAEARAQYQTDYDELLAVCSRSKSKYGTAVPKMNIQAYVWLRDAAVTFRGHDISNGVLPLTEKII